MKKLKVPFYLLMFYYWSWSDKILPGILVCIPIWIQPMFMGYPNPGWEVLSPGLGVPRSCLRGYHQAMTGTPQAGLVYPQPWLVPPTGTGVPSSQDRGTPWIGLGYPLTRTGVPVPSGQVMLRIVHLWRFPAGRLSLAYHCLKWIQ